MIYLRCQYKVPVEYALDLTMPVPWLILSFGWRLDRCVHLIIVIYRRSFDAIQVTVEYLYSLQEISTSS